MLYDKGILRSKSYPLPIICVGNITVGGTGKTPVTEYIVRLLKRQYSMAILSRGYRRKTKGFVLGNAKSTVSQIGDEPVQIQQKFPNITVAVCEDRQTGIEQLMTLPKKIDTIILDDAFQHRKVKAGLNLLLMDFNQLIYEDHLLPYGRLREPIEAKERADIIVVTKCNPEMRPIDVRIIIKNLELRPYQTLFFSYIKYGDFYQVFEEKEVLSFGFDYNQTRPAVLLVTGIANNQSLVDHLKGFVSDMEVLSFPDHHSFTENDLKEIVATYSSMPQQEKIIVTTEKDAIRFRNLKKVSDILKNNMYYIPIEIGFLYNRQEIFDQLIIDYVRTNKRIS